MTFNSPVFLFAFLPLCFFLFFLSGSIGGDRWKAVVLLIVSYLFYIYNAGLLAVLLLCSTLIDFFLAFPIAFSRHQRRLWLTLGVAFNVGLLGYFKYANFFVSELNKGFHLLGFDPIPWKNVALPIGVSFFTFQKISYLVDVYRQRCPPEKNFLRYALFVAFFPKLLSGPIVRYRSFHAQPTAAGLRERFHEGAVRFSWGLAKKVLLARAFAEIADAAFHLRPPDLGVTSAWLGAVAYTFQIYFDFSGYTDMAIGLALFFGYRLPENFRRPYSAVSVTDFWRRWHITLSEWLRDYLYIPLGGNRISPGRTYFNLFIVFSLCGIWHGADWNFLVWGLVHGLYLVFERISAIRDLSSNRYPALRRLTTFILVTLAWVFFRVEAVLDGVYYLSAMFTPKHVGFSYDLLLALNTRNLFFCGIGILSVTLPPDFTFSGYLLSSRTGLLHRFASLALITVLFPYCLIQIVGGSFNPFIYFRF